MSGSRMGDFLTGLIVGGAVGYVFAVLSAPRTGEETRQMITEKRDELRDRALGTVQGAVEKTNKLVDEGKARVTGTIESTVNRTIEQVDEVKGKGTAIVDDARSQVSETLRRAAERVDPNGPSEGAA